MSCVRGFYLLPREMNLIFQDPRSTVSTALRKEDHLSVYSGGIFEVGGGCGEKRFCGGIFFLGGIGGDLQGKGGRVGRRRGA